jgi:branched-chain amino acid transport system permease protein
MLDTPRARIMTGLGLVLLLALPLLAEATDNSFVTGLFTRFLIYALAAVSLDLILGYGGMVSFGHAAFFGVGGYAVGILAFHAAEKSKFLGFIPGTESFLVSIPAAILVGGVVALIIGSLSLRTRGIHFIMITLAFAQMIFFIFTSLSYYGGDDGLIISRRNQFPGLDLTDDATFYYVCFGLLAIYTYLCHRLLNARFGMVVRGARDSERRMLAVGFPVYRYQLTAFIIAGMGAAIAGGLYANLNRFASPDMMHWTRSGEIMIMVILGGMSSLAGPIVGAALFLGLEAWLTSYTEHWALFLGAVLLAAMLFTKSGLWAALTGKRA